MWTNEAPYAAIKSAEQSLMASATRKDARAVRALPASDFAEIGRSGKLWTAPETIAALASEEPRDNPDISEWRYNEIANGVVLVTYRVHTPERDSRHSSVWDLTSGRAVLRFHQGTVIPRG